MLRKKVTSSPTARSLTPEQEHRSLFKPAKKIETASSTGGKTIILVDLPESQAYQHASLRTIVLQHSKNCSEAKYALAETATPEPRELVKQGYAVTYVFFMRHCFSCSNDRKKRYVMQSVVQNPFCDFDGVMQPASSARAVLESFPLLTEHLRNLGLPDLKADFQLGSSLLLRAMQTAAIASMGLKAARATVRKDIWRVPHVMEEANAYDITTSLPVVRSVVRSSQNSVDDLTSRAEARELNAAFTKKLGKDEAPEIDAGACKPVPCTGEKYTIRNVAKQQCRFLEEVLPHLPTSDAGASLIVSHGGTMRKSLLQGVMVRDDRGKETNPHPENTETILCAFLRKGAACPLVVVCGRVVASPRLDDVSGKNAYDVGEHCSKTVRHIFKW